MKPTIILLLLLILSSCSSVNRTLKKIKTDPKTFNAVQKYLIEDLKICVNDTVTISKDSITYLTKDSIIRDTVDTPCPDFTKKTSNGATVTSKNGILTVDYPVKTKEKLITRTITNNIRDLKLESMLKVERDTALKQLNITESNLKVRNLELKSAKNKLTFTYIGIGLVLLLGIGIKTGLFKKFIPFL